MTVRDVVLCDIIGRSFTFDALNGVVRNMSRASSAKIIGRITGQPPCCASSLRDLGIMSHVSDEDCTCHDYIVIHWYFELSVLTLHLASLLSSHIGSCIDKFSTVLMISALVIEIGLYAGHGRRNRIAIAPIVELYVLSTCFHDRSTLLHLSQLVIDDYGIQYDLRMIEELRSHRRLLGLIDHGKEPTACSEHCGTTCEGHSALSPFNVAIANYTKSILLFRLDFEILDGFCVIELRLVRLTLPNRKFQNQTKIVSSICLNSFDGLI